MTDEVTTEGVEEALRAAASSLTEQLDALGESIAYHDARARELRETRKRVLRVQAIVVGDDARKHNGGGATLSPEGKRRLVERTTRRHAEERQAKKDRVREYVQGLPPDFDILAADVAETLNDPTVPNHHPQRLGRQLAVDLLRELRDEGVVRLDRVGAGGQAHYRVVGGRRE